MVLSARVQRHLVAYGYAACIGAVAVFFLALGDHFQSQALANTGGWIATLHIFFWRRNPLGYRLLQRVLVSAFRCRRCRTLWPLRQYWRCTCGATTERHLFKPCPNCQKIANYAVCAGCQTAEIV